MDSNGQIVVPSALLDNVIQFVEISSLTAKRALDEVEIHRQAQKRASDFRSVLLDHLVKSKVVAERQKVAADAMLGSHAETMQLLKAAVDKIVELKGTTKTAGDEPGHSVDPAEVDAPGGSYQKVGEYNSLTTPFVGQKTSFVKESDKPFLALIGR